MSKNSKLVDRFLSKPKDLTWDELVKVLASYGYVGIKEERKNWRVSQKIFGCRKPCLGVA